MYYLFLIVYSFAGDVDLYLLHANALPVLFQHFICRVGLLYFGPSIEMTVDSRYNFTYIFKNYNLEFIVNVFYCI